MVFLGNEDIKNFPSSLYVEGIKYIYLPMFCRVDALGFEDNNTDPSIGFTGWGKKYIEWAKCYKGWIRDVIHELAVFNNACQYNCNAGKDRTKIISSIIFSIKGVDENDIAFDYCISRTMLKPRYKFFAKQWGDYFKDEQGELIENHSFYIPPKILWNSF